MESFIVRYRNLLVLLALLVAQILGLAMQVRRTRTALPGEEPGDGRSVMLLRLWANGVVYRRRSAFCMGPDTGVYGFWHNYIDLRHVRQENQDLQKTVDRLRLEQAALLEDAKQGQRLQALLNFQQKYIYKTVAAQAIGTSGTDQSRVFYYRQGQERTDWSAIWPSSRRTALWARCATCFRHSAQVLAINDQSSGAGVILESTRIRGILRGQCRRAASDRGHHCRPADPSRAKKCSQRAATRSFRADCRWALSRKWCAIRSAMRLST